MMQLPAPCSGVTISPSIMCAEYHRRERLKIHDQRGAKRADADCRYEHEENCGRCSEAHCHQSRPTTVGLRRIPCLRRNRNHNEDHKLRDHRIPGGQPCVGIGEERAADDQYNSTAARRAERKSNAGQRQPGRMGADHDRKAEERNQRTDGAAPGQTLEAARRSNKSGQQRVDEIGRKSRSLRHSPRSP